MRGFSKVVLFSLISAFAGMGCRRTAMQRFEPPTEEPSPEFPMEMTDMRMGGVRPMEIAAPMFIDAGPMGDAGAPDVPSIGDPFGDVCGDGIVTPGEDCDEGVPIGCPPGVVSCVLCVECRWVGRTAPTCGNGVMDPGEACDDGNHERDDGCTDCIVD